ncbi:MAG: exodeoxyribonuclease VII small subunit [Pseudomonadota bacterium]|nr:MAG: exodeoxyribonuclease VII small subunit [Pseudomonadota bacterium]
MKELEALVERMEQGELSLEQSLGDFERGVELYRICREALDSAEQKVRMLVEKSGESELTEFNEE